MGRNECAEDGSRAILVSAQEYFREAVEDALASRRMKTFALAQGCHSIELLERYMDVANLFDEIDDSGRRTRPTLAETFLKASNADSRMRVELLEEAGR